jgi:hypothetical protein
MRDVTPVVGIQELHFIPGFKQLSYASKVSPVAQQRERKKTFLLLIANIRLSLETGENRKLYSLELSNKDS